MHRFYINPEQYNGEEIRIVGEDVNHMKNVLRMKEGEELICCDGNGKEYVCQVAELNKEYVLISVEKEQTSVNELPVRTILFQGLPKKDKMELIIQKAVELGVAEIVPVMTKRTIVKLEDKKKEEKKIERWQSIALSAAKQSGRGIIPLIQPVMSWKEMLDYMGKLDYNIILYENAFGMKGTKECIKTAVKQNSVGILVGPEGGFEETEVAQATGQGAMCVSLGHRILRTETAGFTMLAALMLEAEYESEE